MQTQLAQVLSEQLLASKSSNGPPEQTGHLCIQVVDALHHAGTDKRVQGLIACIGRNLHPQGLAELQELRNAVHDFRLHADYCSSWLLHLHTCPDC